jgi:hypothetical protein
MLVSDLPERVSMATPTPPARDPLGTALQQTEAKLVEKLDEACVPEARDVSDESTAELAKLSDTLLAAARAAKDVIMLRRRRREEVGTAGETTEGEAIREFTDRDGRAWRVWAVTPTHLRASKREASLGEFEHGWLAFETIDELSRKRLPHYPADWITMSEAKLQELLGLAVEARRAEPKRPDARNEPPH